MDKGWVTDWVRSIGKDGTGASFLGGVVWLCVMKDSGKQHGQLLTDRQRRRISVC